MYKFFCNYCGYHFKDSTPPKDHGLIDVVCPVCGSYDIYPDTPEGAAQSVKDMTAYENSLIE